MLFSLLAVLGLLALAAPILGRLLGRNAGWPLSVGLIGLAAAALAMSSGGASAESVSWMPTLGIGFSLRLDGLGLLFALLVLGIGAIVIAYSARYLGAGSQASFYGLMLLFAFGMLGLVLADDVIVMFVMWEITTLCSFFLIARSGPNAREPAIRTLLVTAAGGLSLLSAVIIMTVAAGTSNLSAILAADFWSDPATATTLAVLLALAAFTKSAQFPFQGWLPDSMVAITPVSAYLHAAAMVKAGIYLLLRFSPALAENTTWSVLLISAGLTTAVIGAVAALRRHDLKELLAYSTLSQLGFLVATIGIGTPEALAAAAVHTIAHALFKSTLFMVVGVVDHQAGTRDMRELTGLRRSMPVTAGVACLAAASMAGVPLLLGFVSKESMLTAMLDAPGPAWLGPVAAGVAVLAATCTFAYSARFIIGAFGGAAPSPTSVREGTASFLAPLALTAAAGLVFGLAPALLDGLVAAAATASVGEATDVHLEIWHGVNLPLLLSGVILGVGALLVVARRRVDQVAQRLVFPWSALGIVDVCRASIISFGTRVGDLTRSDVPTRHLAIPMVSLAVLAAVGVLSMGALPDIVPGGTPWTDWVLVGAIAVGVLGGVTSRRRIAVLAIVGVVGFAMTLWFFTLGAADVALTQLLVEVLTVVVIVLVLRRLPPAMRRVRRRRAALSALLAAGAGIATFLGVLAFTGRRELSDAGAFFLQEAEAITGGTNVVNTILVDFRAFDTLGELTVLGVAGLSVIVLLHARDMLPIVPTPAAPLGAGPLLDGEQNAVFGRAAVRILGPVIILLSLLFLLRGHNEPGGGFISALIGGAGFAMLYLTASSDDGARIRWPYVTLIGAGIAIGVVTGFLGYVEGSFLTALHADVLGYHFTTALIFDVGVYLAVIGVALATFNELGRRTPAPPPTLVRSTERSSS